MKKKFGTLRPKGCNPKKIPFISFDTLITVVDAYSLEECPTIVEIGAYEGGFTKILSNTSPSSRIFAIEADERILKTLAINTENLRNVKLIQALIGPENRDVQFNLAKVNGEDTSPSTLSNKLHSSIEGFEINYVPKTIMSCTLSRFCESHNLSFIELLILDVTRAELDILNSSPEVIDRVNWIMLRIYNKNQSLAVEGSPSFQDYLNFLIPRGFALEFIVHHEKFLAFRRTY